MTTGVEEAGLLGMVAMIERLILFLINHEPLFFSVYIFFQLKFI